MSLRELWSELKAAQRLQRESAHRDLARAWYGAVFTRMKKLPRLADVLRDRGGRQTFEEQVSVIRGLSKTYGGKLRTVSDGR